ncbi:hypothetical protein N0V90_006570 [Kalmusia sp. IMI 367209]|nr:hypothetical protein N0V90_006570 [Kalmusia sp. IMI 367209]
MLARGALCRLAADVPKTSTHDLPRISQLLHTSLFSRSATSRSTLSAIARAYNATVLERRRAYATKSATQPTAKVKSDVKKAAAKKPAKKPAAKKAASKKPKRKTVAKKKKAVPKKAAKKKVKKVLTPEEKEAQTIKDLKKRALRPPTLGRASAWVVFASESVKGASAHSVVECQQAIKVAASKFKTLTPAEKEHYNHLAQERAEAKRAEYDAWIRQHTPEEIRAANYARTRLRGKLPGRWTRLVDERHTVSPAKIPPYIRFYKERYASGDFKNIAIGDGAKLIGNEWRALNASEKQKYVDAYEADKAAA